MLQRGESRVMRKIAQLMLDEGIRPFLTVHDSFILPQRYADRTKEIIQNVFAEIGVQPPRVKTELL